MRKALLVIDVQNYFMNPLTWDLPRKIKKHIENNKDSYKLIIFTHFVNTPKASVYRFLDWKECMNSPDIDIVKELQPVLPYGVTIPKDVLSVSKVPQTKKLLDEKKIDELYLCGIDTDCCVLATAYDAFDQGYRVRLLENLCMTATGKNLHDAAISMFKKNVGFIAKA